MNTYCIPNVGYIDSPEFLTLSLHFCTIISTPIHCLGVYCILFKTPEQMSTVKWYLLTLHTWIVLFDYSLTILVIPFVMMPSFAGFPIGVLTYFEIPTIIQTILVLNIFTFLCGSIVSIYENRFYTICAFPGKTRWAWWRRFWLAIHYIAPTMALLPVAFLVPDQKSALKKVFESLPCLPQYIYDGPVFVVAEDYTYHVTGLMIFVTIICLEIFIFVCFMFWNVIKQLKAKVMSQKTFQMQKKFFIALVIQVQAPLFMFLFPLIYVLIVILNKYYNQAFVNMMFVIASIHGCISTLVMLLIHKPYRDAVRDMFFKRSKKTRKTSQKDMIFRSNRTSIAPICN